MREDAREVDFVCSTDTIDSYGERVAQNWDLKRFAKNPVALFGHDSRSLPIGSWHNMRVENGQLVGTLKLGSALANPLSEQVWQCIREKTLCAVSVGFIPHTVRWQKENDVEVMVLDDNELMECSVVPIPANPEAVALMRARAIEAFRAKSAESQPNPPAPSSAHKEPTMATETETVTKKAKDDEEMTCPKCGESFKPKGAAVDAFRAKAAEAELAAAKADERTKTIEADRDAKVKAASESLEAEKALKETAQKALAEANDKVLGLEVDAEILPLLGTKMAPAEREGHVAIGKLYLAQGEAGAAKWKSHVEGIKSRSDIPQKVGGSVIEAEGEIASTMRGDGDDGQALVAILNERARKNTDS